MGDAQVHFLIVGAGFAGAATAWHLTRRGARDVLILERELTPGEHSSGRNAGIVRTHADDPQERSLVAEGADVLRRGELSCFVRNGIMLMGLGEEDVAPRFPRARGRGAWCPDDGLVDVAALLRTYLAACDVQCGTTFSGYTVDGDRVRAHTSRGDVTCRVLINAAGAWAGQWGGLPLTAMNRHLFQTAPLDWVRPDWPTVWDGRRKFYFRPESGGLLLCVCDETPAEPGDYREDPAVLEELEHKIRTLQPGLGAVAIRTQWVGQRTFAPDRRFVIGFDPREPRLFHVAGLGGHGVTGSYAVGRLAADLLLGQLAPDAEAFSPARLHSSFVRRSDPAAISSPAG